MSNEKLTLEERIYKEIKKAIFSRKIKPQTVLSEEQLAEAFDVSRTPVRHVLKRMHYENIIEIKPKKGAFIYEPTTKEIAEAFYVKSILEKEALKVVALKITEAELQKLEKMTYQEEAHYQNGEYYEGLMVANEFHDKLIAIKGNQLLIKYYNDLTDMTNLYLAFYDTVMDYPPGPVEHRAIINAIRTKDQALIEKEISQHWARVKEYMVYNRDENVDIDFKSIFTPIDKK